MSYSLVSLFPFIANFPKDLSIFAFPHYSTKTAFISCQVQWTVILPLTWLTSSFWWPPPPKNILFPVSEFQTCLSRQAPLPFALCPISWIPGLPEPPQLQLSVYLYLCPQTAWPFQLTPAPLPLHLHALTPLIINSETFLKSQPRPGLFGLSS